MPTGLPSVAPCPNGAAWWPCPTPSSTQTPPRGATWCGSRSASAWTCWRRPPTASHAPRTADPGGASPLRVVEMEVCQGAERFSGRQVDRDNLGRLDGDDEPTLVVTVHLL